MPDEKTFTESDGHLYFAKHYNLKTWELLDKPSRTRDEEEMMLDFAHTSLAHWRVVGTPVNHQRGEWMISRVHAVTGNGALALQHAQRCLELTEAHRAEMKDFDLASAYEGMARAHALQGDRADAERYIERAQRAGDVIENDEDRAIFFSEFNGGSWHGVR